MKTKISENDLTVAVGKVSKWLDNERLFVQITLKVANGDTKHEGESLKKRIAKELETHAGSSRAVINVK